MVRFYIFFFAWIAVAVVVERITALIINRKKILCFLKGHIWNETECLCSRCGKTEHEWLVIADGEILSSTQDPEVEYELFHKKCQKCGREEKRSEKTVTCPLCDGSGYDFDHFASLSGCGGGSNHCSTCGGCGRVKV